MSLRQFNDTVRLFINDLKNIFGENDRDIIRIELLTEMLSMNARLVIRPFQDSICNNDLFVQNIMRDNAEYFLNFPFEKLSVVNENEFYMKLLYKFREAIANQTNKKTLSAIFNWFKIMIFHAYSDMGVDADKRMRSIAVQPSAATDKPQRACEDD